MGKLKIVLVKITEYTLIKDALELIQYTIDCVNTGSAATLYKDPNITTAFYTSLTEAADGIQIALKMYTRFPTKGNKKAIGVAMDAAVEVLNSYSAKVVPIANLPANAATLEAAYANILLSHLTPQKLGRNKKGDPQIPELKITDLGGGKARVEIINGGDFHPSSLIIMAVSLPGITVPPANPPLAPPIVILNKGIVSIFAVGAFQMLSTTIEGKGRDIIFPGFIKGVIYVFYAYAQNGKKQISQMCVGVVMEM